MQGIIFNIQSYSLHDGPGIRTMVFLKGCPLRCPWCANPESQLIRPEVYLDDSKCIRNAGCTLCDGICRCHALSGGRLLHGRCIGCGACLPVCPSRALGIYGQTVETEEVLDRVERESVFFAHGEGGLTLSGGEPFFQSEFALELLRGAKKRRIRTAVETCGYCETEVLREAAGYLDYILYDLKSMDAGKHARVVGVDNSLILNNLEILFGEFPNLHKHVRMPVIPGFNDTDEDIRAIRVFLEGRQNYTYEQLPYHRFGERKYELLGRKAEWL
ncbi:MAG: glycyl-radical enzyme activating protein [Clostridiales bacterium]|nr:glycyl-radical enzyme activating protein [Clostridiales bacterium]